MKISDLLKGKKVNVFTDAKVTVQLEIQSANEKHCSRDLTPATRENDWWPPSEEWTVFDVTFTNGYTKQYRSFSDIDIVE